MVHSSGSGTPPHDRAKLANTPKLTQLYVQGPSCRRGPILPLAYDRQADEDAWRQAAALLKDSFGKGT